MDSFIHRDTGRVGRRRDAAQYVAAGSPAAHDGDSGPFFPDAEAPRVRHARESEVPGDKGLSFVDDIYAEMGIEMPRRKHDKDAPDAGNRGGIRSATHGRCGRRRWRLNGDETRVAVRADGPWGRVVREESWGC